MNATDNFGMMHDNTSIDDTASPELPFWVELLYDGADLSNMSNFLLPNKSWGTHGNHNQNARLANKPDKVIAIILSIIGILANLISLVAIMRVRGHLTANLRLIVSLCSSDMITSLSLLFFISHAEMEMAIGLQGESKDTCLFIFARNLRSTATIITLLNLVGLAFDHYIAIIRPLDHTFVMGRGRANAMISCFWVIAVLCGFADFYIPFPKYSFCEKNMHFCESVFCNQFTGEYIMFAIALVSFVLMTSFYARIYLEIIRYQAFHNQHRANVRRNRRGLLTTFFIVLTFLICWLPYCLYEIVVLIDTAIHPGKGLKYMKITAKIDFYLFDIILLNSIFDPLIYALRMREVQFGCRRAIQPCLNRKHVVRKRYRHSFDTVSTSRTSQAVPMTSLTNGFKSTEENQTSL